MGPRMPLSPFWLLLFLPSTPSLLSTSGMLKFSSLRWSRTLTMTLPIFLPLTLTMLSYYQADPKENGGSLTLGFMQIIAFMCWCFLLPFLTGLYSLIMIPVPLVLYVKRFILTPASFFSTLNNTEPSIIACTLTVGTLFSENPLSVQPISAPNDQVCNTDSASTFSQWVPSRHHTWTTSPLKKLGFLLTWCSKGC